MKNTITPNPHYQNQTRGNGFPFLSTAALTSAAVALGAAVLLASPSTAEDRRTTLAPADERRQIGEIATRIAGDKKTDNQLEIVGADDRE